MATHADFARAVREALSPGAEGEEEEQGAAQARKQALQLFEDKYCVLADEAKLAEEQAVCRFLPRPLDEMPQRLLQAWCIVDKKGRYLAPWHASHAVSPGGVFGTLQPAPPLPGRLKRTEHEARDGQDAQEDADAQGHAAPLRVRLNAPDEWQAQCLDATGCALPRYWLRGAASTGTASKLGPRGGPGKVWYQLGSPAEGYVEFLRSESWWLMGAYRIAHFLHAAPKSTFNEVAPRLPLPFFCPCAFGPFTLSSPALSSPKCLCPAAPPEARTASLTPRERAHQVVDVLAGRNWASGEDDGGEAKRLDQLPLQDVLERADHVIEVRLRRFAVRVHLPVSGTIGVG